MRDHRRFGLGVAIGNERTPDPFSESMIAMAPRSN
jgi:hypothetical protein